MAGFTLDGEDHFKPIFSLVCTHCKHLDMESAVAKKPVCKAFPKKIPDEIWQGKNDHTKPYPGDNGIQFTPHPDSPKFKTQR
jgi:hypothetical protein